jgi:transposase
VYTALSTQEWLQSNFPQFSDKNTWAPNSPDLSPIENIWVIIKERVNMSSPQPRDLQKLQQTAETCWKKIDSETMKNL